jgi:hypothetical protein
MPASSRCRTRRGSRTCGAVLPRPGSRWRTRNPALAEILQKIKAREDEGYSYDTAQASFELLARETLGIMPRFFEVKRYRVTVERRKNKYNRMVSLSEAVVVVKIGEDKMLSVSESMDEQGSDRGPVNALAKALAKDLGPYQSYIDDIRLVDFKVRITQGGHRGRHPRRHRQRGQQGPPLGHGRRLAQHRGRQFRGAAGRDRMEAGARRGAGGMRGLVILALPLLLAACEDREVVSICAATGEIAGTVTAALHDADGGQAVLISDAAAGQSLVARSTRETPVLADLWRLAETTMRSLPDTEPSPCGLDTLTMVRVTFNDGSTMTRQSTCTGNALSRVASGVLDAAPRGTVAEDGTPDGRGPVTGILEACERLQ